MISKKELYGVAALLLIVAMLSWAFPGALNRAGGASGSLSAEDYDGGYLRQAGGFFSSLPITLNGASGDITTGDDLTVTDDATVSGGSLVVTTSNSATSTVAVGCIQMYATSTASAFKLVIAQTGTTTTAYTGNTMGYFVLAQNGVCP